MPDIPLLQKFHTVAEDVVTENRGSAVANANRTIFTMQDIINTVDSTGGGGLSGSGTSNYLTKFTGASSVGDSPFMIASNYLQLPSLIRLIGNTNSSYGFSASNNFSINTTAGTQLQVTDAGVAVDKLSVTTAVVPNGVSLGSLNVTFGTAPTVTSYGTIGDIIITAAGIYVCTVTGVDPTPATWLKAALGPL
jgi:hypothetical protein